MHPICRHAVTANFTNSKLDRQRKDAEALLANPPIRKFVDG
jgi:hypothetical protein